MSHDGTVHASPEQEHEQEQVRGQDPLHRQAARRPLLHDGIIACVFCGRPNSAGKRVLPHTTMLTI